MGCVQRSNGLSLSRLGEHEEAAAFAEEMGRPLTALVTIVFHGVQNVEESVIRICDSMRHWLRRQGLPAIYIWVKEFGSEHGVHIHLAVHVPAGAVYWAFKKMVWRWAEQAGAEILRGGSSETVDVRRIYSINGLLKYLGKSVSSRDAPKARERYGIDRKPHASVGGRASQVCKALGPKARMEWYARHTDIAA